MEAGLWVEIHSWSACFLLWRDNRKKYAFEAICSPKPNRRPKTIQASQTQPKWHSYKNIIQILLLKLNIINLRFWNYHDSLS